jgi:hypothetical protein
MILCPGATLTQMAYGLTEEQFYNFAKPERVVNGALKDLGKKSISFSIKRHHLLGLMMIYSMKYFTTAFNKGMMK